METVDFPVGTHVEIWLGLALPGDPNNGLWGEIACRLARCGTQYPGKSSPWWYDVDQFAELLFASGDRPVRELIANLDGCTGGKAGEIVAAAGLGRTACRDVTTAEAATLLSSARRFTRQVNPKRLGTIGPTAFPESWYAVADGEAHFGARPPHAVIPFVVEAWVKTRPGDTSIDVCVNRTPITGDVYAARDKRDIDVHGCGIHRTVAQASKDVQFGIWVNITTPYMPITSDGKAPDLAPFFAAMTKAVSKAVRVAYRPGSTDRPSQKEVVLNNLDDVIAEVSGGGKYRFNQRQLLYKLRPIVQERLGEELTTNNFTRIITDYEAEYGEIPGMYREPRGSIYHPHKAETITLGDLMVEKYQRPAWLYNKIVYIEKEGFSEALKDERWPERHDCMLMSSKGFGTRAARDLIDKLAEHDEPVTIFCVHDADAHGTMIYQTLQEETMARGARKIKIVNLGLEPWEAIAMGLEIERAQEKDTRRPVADYVCEHPGNFGATGVPVSHWVSDWEEWLQAHRVELNAMSTPQFIEWLNGKMAGYSKLVPPEDVISEELNKRIETKVRETIENRILREANIDAQVASAIAAIEKPDMAALLDGIRELFESKPESEWRDRLEAVVDELTESP